MIPLQLSFGPVSSVFSYLDVLVDIVFFIDFLLMFMTTYKDFKSMREIIDHKLIAKHYVNSLEFLFDFLSILGGRPFSSINTTFKNL
jgi:hypothetical protein